jgi:membrane-bound inhibitor of C-type lysozyme
MKKRILVFIAVVAVLTSQFASLPLTVKAADIWIDDADAPNGGYWMDEEGYIIDDGSEGSNYVLDNNEDGSLYENNESVQSFDSQVTGATSGRITGITAEAPGMQQFQYSSDGAVEFKFLKNGIEVSGVDYSSSGNLLTVNDPNTDYTVVMYSTQKPFISSARTVFAYRYQVIYNLDGRTVIAAEGNINKSDSSTTHKAPLLYADSGLEYELAGGENVQTQLVAYENMTGTYTFDYSAYQPQDRTLTIKLNDDRGNKIQTLTETVKYKDGDVTVEIPQQLEKDGRKYQIRDTISSVTVNYFSSRFDYSYTYRELAANNKDPYSVKVLFREEGTEKALGEDYFIISAQNIADNQVVTYEPGTERSILEGTARMYYALTNPVKIEHKAAVDYEQTVYTVYYKKQAEDAPYNWILQLTDVSGGTVLDTISKQVTINTNVTYEAESQITVNGKKYILNAQMPKEYTHNYGDETRTQVIYYEEEGQNVVSAYSLNLQYRSITDNSVLYRTQKEMKIEEPVAILSTEEEYTDADGQEYVRLPGQDNLTHDFASAQRTVTVYYRNVNDIQNADTVVTREEVTTREQIQTVNVTADADTTDVADSGVLGAVPGGTIVSQEAIPGATLANETTGQLVTVDEEGVPLSDTADELTQIEDEPIPLANQKLESGNHTVVIVTGGIILLLLICGTAFFIVKKRKTNHTKTE